MTLEEKATVLKEYIDTVVRTGQFRIVSVVDGTYGHMGAVITDAILQAGINYESVVRPKIERLLKQWPNTKTTRCFLAVLTSRGVSQILDWRRGKKLARVLALTKFFLAEGVNTERSLRRWLQNDANVQRLKSRRIGVGDKTADYLKLLVGLRTVAVDRHLLNFLKAARIPVSGYKEAHDVITGAANLLNISPQLLDHSIWKHMSNCQREPCNAGCTGLLTLPSA